MGLYEMKTIIIAGLYEKYKQEALSLLIRLSASSLTFCPSFMRSNCYITGWVADIKSGAQDPAII